MAANEILVGVVSVAQLAGVIKNKIKKVLVIDSRSFLEFNACHIVNAVNVCCSKLVKRRLQQDKVSVKDLLTNICQVDVEDKIDVVVYDRSSTDFHSVCPDSFVSVLLQKLVAAFNSVSLLQGGFLEFESKHASLCEDKKRQCVPLVSLSQPCLPISNTGPTRILPFLYLGSQQDAMNMDLLRGYNIMYELNVSTACPKPDFVSDGHFLRISVDDNYSEKLLPHFPKAFQFIDKVREANGCVLVHCLAGISRSPTIAIAYIMRYLHMSSDEAYRYVKSKRATVSPNFNFLGQLLEFQNQLRNENVLQRLKETKAFLCSPVLSNACHKKNTNPKSATKLPDVCAWDGDASSRDFTSKGDNSTVARASLDKDVKMLKDVQLQTVTEEVGSVIVLTHKVRVTKGVRKSQSASNIFTLRNSQWFNGRRSSCDATEDGAFGSTENDANPPSGRFRKQTSGASEKRISFEGVGGIPFSSLDHISFMPCMASGCASHRMTETTDKGSFADPFSDGRLSCISNSGQSPRGLPDAAGDASKLRAANEIFAVAGFQPSPKETSPRPADPLDRIGCDAGEDEGIEIAKDEGETEDGQVIRRERFVSHACSAATSEDLKAGLVECLESSYDSGVFPSPTQFELSEIIRSCKKSADSWLPGEAEGAQGARETRRFPTGAVEHSAQSVDDGEATSVVCHGVTTKDDLLRVENGTAVLLSNRSSLVDCRAPDRLYRTHSCPGIVGWRHHSSSLDALNVNVNVLGKPVQRPTMPRVQFRSRRSCSRLGLVEERDCPTFESCPDFGQYCNSQTELKYKGGDASSLSPKYNRSLIRRTNIIQVS